MALSDPQSVTITGFNGGSAISLPRTQDERFRSVYSSSDNNTVLTVSHSPSGTMGTANFVVQSMIRLDVTKVAADPYNADRFISQTASVWLVVRKPAFGFTAADYTNMVAALFALLSASTYSVTTKLVGGEH